MVPSDVVTDASQCPLLTVEEAARVLRIGRSLAYQLSNEYLATAWVVLEELILASTGPPARWRWPSPRR